MTIIIYWPFPPNSLAKSIYNGCMGSNLKAETFNKISLSLFDALVSAAILILGTLIGSRYAVGPTAWDDTLYLHTAATLTRDPTIMNRYFHIFGLRVGIILSVGDAFAGSYLAGAFFFSLTAALVYLTARMLSGANHPWHGLLALLFLLSEPGFLNYFGSSLSDYTVMAMISLGIFCYLLTTRRYNANHYLLGINGLICFFAFKSKEIGLILVILLISLIVLNNHPFRWRVFLRRTLSILAGILIGSLLFIAVDAVWLKDAWFGLRLSDFQSYVEFNQQSTNLTQSGASYFSAFAQISLLGPFILTLISIASRRNDMPPNEWPIYLLPFGFYGILILSQVKNIGVLDRYSLPVLPMWAMLAPQFIRFSAQDAIDPRARHYLPRIMGYGAAGIGIAYFVSIGLFLLLGKSGNWTQANFVTSILEPLGLIILLLAVFRLPAHKTWGFITLLGLTALITLPSIQLYRIDLLSGRFRQANLYRFSPMTEFKNQVQCTQGNVFVSQHYHDNQSLLSRDQQSSLWMFDLAFNCASQKSQFDISPLPNQILDKRYQYVFLPKEDFDSLMAEDNTANPLTALYAVTSANHQLFYLLSAK